MDNHINIKHKTYVDTTRFGTNCAYGHTFNTDPNKIAEEFAILGANSCWVRRLTLLMNKQTGISGIVCEKADNTKISVGLAEGPGSSLPPNVFKCDWTFVQGEIFKRVLLVSNGVRLTGIRITTSKQEKEAYMDGSKIPPESTTGKPIVLYQMIEGSAIGSGTCVGIFGNSSDHVEFLGFAMKK